MSCVLYEFIWNVAPVVYIAVTSRTGQLASLLPGILSITDISDIIHSFDHDKLSSVSQLINRKARDLQTKITQIF